MPLYEFECDSCGGRFERLLWREPDRADPGPACACGSTHVERVLYSRVSVGAKYTPSSPRCDNAPAAGCCGGGACGN